MQKETSEVVIAELTILYLIGIVENKRRTTHETTASGQTVGLDMVADSASGIFFLPHSLVSQHFVQYDFAEKLMGPLTYAQERLPFNGLPLCPYYIQQG